MTGRGETLRPSEVRILKLLAEGKTLEEIAKAVYCGRRTLYNQMGTIRKKTRSRTNAQAVLRAYIAGLFDV